MPPRGIKGGSKLDREYEHIKASYKEIGTSEGRAEEIAARTVNKEKREEGKTEDAKKS